MHFPFCTNLCSYCDFYKERYTQAAIERFFRALTYETETVLSSFGHEPIDIGSIYIGGGTPSLADPELLERWLETVLTYGRLMPGYEFTIEANPESLRPAFAAQTLAMGANRVVIGVQSFAVGLLRRLNRRLRIKDIYQAFYFCRTAGYQNIAADLIFGLPQQRMRQLRIDIERLAALEPDHISFYQLTVEPETRLADRIAAGRIALPDDETCASMYRFGAHLLVDQGYLRYEVSNFARPGRLARHNFAYWQGSPYIGLGPAAHGFANNRRYGNLPSLGAYIDRLEAGHLPIAFVEELSSEQQLMEAIMLSLRTAEGIDKARLIRRFGAAAIDILQGPASSRYVRSGHLDDDEGWMRLTDDGFLIADSIIADLVG